MLDNTYSEFAAASQVWQDQLSCPAMSSSIDFRPRTETRAARRSARALILDVETIVGQRYAVLAYGTTAIDRVRTRGLRSAFQAAKRVPQPALDEGLDALCRRPEDFLFPLRKSAGFDICSETDSPCRRPPRRLRVPENEPGPRD